MTTQAQASPWYRQIVAVVLRHGYLKGIGTTVFISAFFVAYFYVLHHPAYPPTVIPVLWLDRQIRFEPLALPVYLSLWLYVSLVPALASTRRVLCRMGLAMVLMCMVGLLIFYFWPTRISTMDVAHTAYPAMDFLKTMDASGNAFPSLHVAAAVCAGIFLNHLLRGLGCPLWVHRCNWAWCMGIVYSTLAVRQHVVLDVAGGLVLGGLTAWLSLAGGRAKL